MSGPRAEFVLVTPKMATELLGHAPLGRLPSGRMVERFTKAIENGERICAPILIATDGTLADGLQRMSAVVASGVSVRMLLIRDVPLSALVPRRRCCLPGLKARRQLARRPPRARTSP